MADFNVLKYLPAHYKTAQGTFLYAILAGYDNAEGLLRQQIQACIDQLFITTASGRYLLNLANSMGFTLPANNGLDISAYTELVPTMVSSPKQVRQTIEDLIEAFYGLDRTRPSIISTMPGPYALQDGDNLVIQTDATTIVLSINATQVANINNVSAAEVAGIINSTVTGVFASVYTDRQTLNQYVNLIANTRGANAYLTIVGGSLQNVVQWPKVQPTNFQTGQTFNVSKPQAYSDQLTIQWAGTGLNPNFFVASPGDTICIRGLTDNAYPVSQINGSYAIVDIGYDYVVVANSLYQNTAGSFTLPAANSIVITSSDPNTLFDQAEYAETSEADGDNTGTITIPAVPPLVRRFLAGSSHLQGNICRVQSFTRASVTFVAPGNIGSPAAINWFLLSNSNFRFDATKKHYHTFQSDGLASPTYQVDTSDISYAFLPFTTPALIGTDAVYGTVGSTEYSITFPYKHGLQKDWGFTLSNATGSGNITALLLSKEQYVYRIIDDYTLTFQILGPKYALPWQGIAVPNVDVYRYATIQEDGADFYLQFPDAATLAASGLVPGMTFTFDGTAGTNTDPFFGTQLRQHTYAASSVGTTTVSFVSGYGIGPQGETIAGATVLRSGGFGGAVSYMFDQTSAYNQAFVMSGLSATFLGYTPSVNPAYVGSYVFDPEGTESLITVSGYVTETTQEILEGSNDNVLMVQAVSGVFNGLDFPSSGQLVIDYGIDTQEGPISYLATISGESPQIIIDPSYVFKYTHDVGANVQYIHANQPYTPKTDGTDYPVYVTGSTQGRNTMVSLIESLIASGIFVNVNVELPALEYADPAIEPFQ